MCMAVDETAGKTLVSFAVLFAAIFTFFLLHLVVANGEQHDNAVFIDNNSKSGGTNKNKEVHGPLATGSLDAHQREAPTTASSPLRGERLFNASAHEVPSGPNPISNR